MAPKQRKTTGKSQIHMITKYRKKTKTAKKKDFLAVITTPQQTRATAAAHHREHTTITDLPGASVPLNPMKSDLPSRGAPKRNDVMKSDLQLRGAPKQNDTISDRSPRVRKHADAKLIDCESRERTQIPKASSASKSELSPREKRLQNREKQRVSVFELFHPSPDAKNTDCLLEVIRRNRKRRSQSSASSIIHNKVKIFRKRKQLCPTRLKTAEELVPSMPLCAEMALRRNNPVKQPVGTKNICLLDVIRRNRKPTKFSSAASTKSLDIPKACCSKRKQSQPRKLTPAESILTLPGSRKPSRPVKRRRDKLERKKARRRKTIG